MVMLRRAAVACPIPVVEHPAVVACLGPVGTLVRRTCPVAVMPLVLVTERIPVAVEPHVLRTGLPRMHANDAGGRWSANPDADRNLSAGDRSAGQQQRCQKYQRDHTSHGMNLLVNHAGDSIASGRWMGIRRSPLW